MDEGPQLAVRTTFVKLYRDGLIYRGERIINWCPRCQTALSDLEVEHKEHASHLWYVRYPLLDDKGEPTGEHITIATTRPETIVADVAVAVNPDDARYRDIVGRTALLPIMRRPIPVIADAAVDPAFGTGALKITPGHDPTDFEVGERHGLRTIVAVGPRRHHERGGRPLRRPGPLRLPRGHRARPGGRRATGEDRALRLLHRPLRALRHRRRAHRQPAVVRAHAASGRSRPSRR